ncbi:hypothetical protein KQX54_015083 [Cotesia glomerata]|uniref:Uncharacterized protein n=1 Tax=Cotesia glomerata TaxID=32391 RepID=A0AAV7IVT5_COTGL|nr:hypothetical protein KQX54_015083 [Cotesia glomerata]
MVNEQANQPLCIAAIALKWARLVLNDIHRQVLFATSHAIPILNSRGLFWAHCILPRASRAKRSDAISGEEKREKFEGQRSAVAVGGGGGGTLVRMIHAISS